MFYSINNAIGSQDSIQPILNKSKIWNIQLHCVEYNIYHWPCFDVVYSRRSLYTTSNREIDYTNFVECIVAIVLGSAVPP